MVKTKKYVWTQKSQNDSSDYLPYMLGVRHKIEYIPPTIDVLKTLDIKGNSFLLEIAEYPIIFPSKDMPWREDANFYMYWNAIASSIIHSGGSIILGNNEDIEEKYKKNFKNIHDKYYPHDLKQYWTKYAPIRKSVVDDYILEKDEHYMKVIAKEKPYGIILGFWHAKALSERMPCLHHQLNFNREMNRFSEKLCKKFPLEDIENIIAAYKSKVPNSRIDYDSITKFSVL